MHPTLPRQECRVPVEEQILERQLGTHWAMYYVRTHPQYILHQVLRDQVIERIGIGRGSNELRRTIGVFWLFIELGGSVLFVCTVTSYQRMIWLNAVRLEMGTLFYLKQRSSGNSTLK